MCPHWSWKKRATFFGDPSGRLVDDSRHSELEVRQVMMGCSQRRRLLVVMFTERGEAIRMIIARRATRTEKQEYEEKQS
jgi:hypothetical protein